MWVVELPIDVADQRVSVLPMQRWGQVIEAASKAREDFRPDLPALAAPFVFPGGNPIKAQGRYGVPVFPCFSKHLDDFGRSADEVSRFLLARLSRTPGFRLDEALLAIVAERIHRAVAVTDLDMKENLSV